MIPQVCVFCVCVCLHCWEYSVIWMYHKQTLVPMRLWLVDHNTLYHTPHFCTLHILIHWTSKSQSFSPQRVPSCGQPPQPPCSSSSPMPVSSTPLWPLLPKSHFDPCHHYCSTSEITDLNMPLSDNFLNFQLVWESAPSARFFHLIRTSQMLITRLSLNLSNSSCLHFPLYCSDSMSRFKHSFMYYNFPDFVLPSH